MMQRINSLNSELLNIRFSHINDVGGFSNNTAIQVSKVFFPPRAAYFKVVCDEAMLFHLLGQPWCVVEFNNQVIYFVCCWGLNISGRHFVSYIIIPVFVFSTTEIPLLFARNSVWVCFRTEIFSSLFLKKFGIWKGNLRFPAFGAYRNPNQSACCWVSVHPHQRQLPLRGNPVLVSVRQVPAQRIISNLVDLNKDKVSADKEERPRVRTLFFL